MRSIPELSAPPPRGLVHGYPIVERDVSRKAAR